METYKTLDGVIVGVKYQGWLDSRTHGLICKEFDTKESARQFVEIQASKHDWLSKGTWPLYYRTQK